MKAYLKEIVPRIIVALVVAVIFYILLQFGRTGERDVFQSPAYKQYLPVVSSGAGGFKGVGVEYGNAPRIDIVNASWWHNWFPDDGMGCLPGFIPTIGRDFLVGVEPCTGGGWLFTFNEPDQPSQADLAPGYVALGWPCLQKRYENYKLIAPTVSQGWYGWIDEFYEKLPEGSRIDALSFNCYLGLDGCKRAATEFIKRAREWGIDTVFLKETNFQDVNDLVEFMNWASGYRELMVGYFIQESENDSDILYSRALMRDGTLTEYGVAYKNIPEVR